MKLTTVKISEVKSNPDNPRIIKDNKFDKLVNSIREFPQMLDIRPIVVNNEMFVLGGNMRLKACKEAGLKEIPIIIADQLTGEQQREFIVKDNVGFGEWDWDMLANEWDKDLLDDWGLDIMKFDESFEEEEMFEGDNSIEKNEVIINLSMPYYQYEELETEFQDFIKKYPNIVCKIQN
tara:strand:- start:4613 stop:5146 length:534 start_codon:yes stop_codon:yes gene_type:complete